MLTKVFFAAVLSAMLAAAAHAQPVWQTGASTATGSSATATLARPSGIAQGDLLIAGVMFEKGSDVAITATGWTLIRRTNNTTNVGMATYYRVVGPLASEPANYAFSFTNGPKWAVGVSRITGADTGVAPTFSEQTGASGDVVAPSLTTSAANSLVLAFYTNKKHRNYDHDVSTTERYDAPNTADGLPSNMMATFVQAVTGATGNKTAHPLESDAWVGQQVAIRPAGTKLYFHDATTPNLGTLPGSSTLSTTTPNGTATGAPTNRDMDETIGTAQASAALTTQATMAPQRNWYRRFVSRPLAAQTLPTGAWTVQGAASEANANSNMNVWGIVLKVWRPSTGATVATLLDNPALSNTEPGTTQTGISTATGSIAGVAVNDGDILLIELWADNTQANTTSYTNTIFYDGTTEGSTTSNAAYLRAPGVLTFHRSLRQAGYRLFNNADSTNVGTALAAQDTAATLTSTGDSFRLRMLIHVADINLGVGGQDFKLQFVGKGSGTCAAPSGGTPAAWTDVTAATAIAYNNNATPADAAALTANANDPTHGGDTVVNQTYEEGNNFSNSAAINRGQDGKWDFSLRDNNASGGTTYCLRAVKSNGTALDTYFVFPEITTAAAAPAIGGFNAYDTATAAGATSGNITTKVAGAATTVHVIALNAAKTAIQTGFTGTVRVEVLDASNNSGALDANGCRPTWSVIQTLSPDPTFVAGDNGRKAVSFTQANSYPNARLRITYPVGAPTATGCSSDNFALRPSSLSVAVTDNTWDSAGTNRTLNNTGDVHKAGRNFTIRISPAPATATNYNGSPSVTASSATCTLPTPCTSVLPSFGTFNSIGSGVRESTTATYSEAGAFNLTVVDDSYAAVDNSDGTPANCSATGRYVCSSALAVGRFVPDHFTITAGATPPQFRSFDTGACSFTYVGQPFGFVDLPSGTVHARNAAGTTTTNYRGTLWKLSAAGVSQAYSMAGKTINPSLGAPTLTEIANSGSGTLSASAADKIAFNRTTPEAPFNANIALTWTVSDTSEAEGTIGTTPALVFSNIAFNANNNEFRFGRLRLGNANGSQLARLPVVVEAQYANSVLAFVTNTADNCTSVTNSNIAVAFSGNLVACETAMLTVGGALAAGRRTFVLEAPGNGNDGVATLAVNLTNANMGSTCTAVGGAGGPATGVNRTYLQGNWGATSFDRNPPGRATFGNFKGAGEVIFIREN